MKKIVCVMLVVVFCVVFLGSAQETFLNFDFTGKADPLAQKTDTVEYTVKISDIQEPGLSSAELLFSYSDGLEFKGCEGVNFSEGFELWTPNVIQEDRSVKIVAIDETVVTPVKNDFEIKLLFTVVSDTLSYEQVKLSKSMICDFDGVEREDVVKNVVQDAFVVNAPKVEAVGASLRVNNTPALRFGARVENVGEYEVKMLVCQGEREEITCDSDGVVICSMDEENGILTTTPIEILSNTQKYTFRPFIETLDGHLIYYNTLVRSAREVAESALFVEDDEKMRELLSTFCTNS